MALDSFTNLKSAILDWMARSDLSGNVEDWITLGEAGLNRELGAVEANQTLTGSSGSRQIDVSSYSIVEPISLFFVDSGSSDERKLVQRSPAHMEYLNTSGEPEFWALDNQQDEINFNRPLDAAYSFRFRYRQRFALSDAAKTNWLLDNHPDVYLAACLVWGGAFVVQPKQILTFKTLLDQELPKVRHTIARNKRGQATVDPALAASPTPGTYQGVG